MLAIARPRPPLLHRPLRADRRVTLTYFTERKQRPSPHARLSRPAVPRETTHVRSKGRAHAGDEPTVRVLHEWPAENTGSYRHAKIEARARRPRARAGRGRDAAARLERSVPAAPCDGQPLLRRHVDAVVVPDRDAGRAHTDQRELRVVGAGDQGERRGAR